MSEEELSPLHDRNRDRKRRHAMPLHGKGFVRLMQEQLKRRAREAADEDE